MQLRHYSDKKIKDLKIFSSAQNPKPYAKPKGFWVSVKGEDDWLTWCQGEEWGFDRLEVIHEVELTKDAQILYLKTAQELKTFNEVFIEPLGTGFSYSSINWNKVAKIYQGIIIAPYQWDCRLNSNINWYYGWDCASGCIWDAEAIASVRELKKEGAK